MTAALPPSPPTVPMVNGLMLFPPLDQLAKAGAMALSNVHNFSDGRIPGCSGCQIGRNHARSIIEPKPLSERQARTRAELHPAAVECVVIHRDAADIANR